MYLNSTVPPVQRRRGRVCLQTPPSAWPPVSRGAGSARHRSGWSPGTRPLSHELTGNYWSAPDPLSPKNTQIMTISHICGYILVKTGCLLLSVSLPLCVCCSFTAWQVWNYSKCCTNKTKTDTDFFSCNPINSSKLFTFFLLLLQTLLWDNAFTMGECWTSYVIINITVLLWFGSVSQVTKETAPYQTGHVSNTKQWRTV